MPESFQNNINWNVREESRKMPKSVQFKIWKQYMKIMLIDVHVISMRTKIRLKKTSYTTANSKIGF